MTNPYTNYYVEQAGSGLAAYQGIRYQKGHGFFGRLLSGAIMPALKYLGRQFLSTGVNIAQDTLAGENIKESAKKHLKDTGKTIAVDALERGKTFVQSGHGRKASGVRLRKTRKAIKRTNQRRKRCNTNVADFGLFA